MAAVILFVYGCDTLDREPLSEPSPGPVFSSAEGVDAAVKGVYDFYGTAWYGLRPFGQIELHTDYVFGIGSENPVSVFDLDATARARQADLWNQMYESINRANVAVSNINERDIADLSEVKRQQFIGEARFLRAYQYFNLVRLWGGPQGRPDGKGVPLRTEPAEGSEENLNVPRSSIGDVYNQIISDLEFAEQNLPESYSGGDRGRATMWAAKAALAKVHLTIGNWSEAEAKADEIVESGQFSLVVPRDTSLEFEAIFGAGAQAGVTNNETIFELNYATTGKTNIGGLFFHSAPSDYYPTGFRAWYGNIDICRVEEAIDTPLNRPEDCGPPEGLADKESFLGPWLEQRNVDKRANYTLYDPSRGPDQASLDSQIPMLFRKFRSPGVFDANNPFPIYRYAEVLYIKSEAEFRQNGASDEAREYLNMMRRRARGLDPSTPDSEADVSPSLSGSAFLDTLLLERAKEFAVEAKRYFDLIRTEKNGELRAFHLAKELGKGTPERRNFNWPIPRQEIDNNDAMSNEDQNPGW